MCESITLSIIIPNYNSGNQLQISLESIYSNPLKFDFEVLVLDNCSIDHPKEIIEKFKFENLYFFSEPDKGVYDAMNKGLLRAKGEWVYFLGAGDSIFINEINRLFLSLNDNGPDLIYGNVFMIQKKMIYDGMFTLNKILRKNICHQAIFYKISTLKKFNYFDKQFKIAADYDLNLKIFFTGSIKKSFEDVIIANYSGNGISDKFRDNNFSKLKSKLILRCLFKNLDFKNFHIVFNYFFWIFFKKVHYEFLKFYI